MSKILRIKSLILQLILIISIFFNFNSILLAEQKKNCLNYNSKQNEIYPKLIEIEISNSAKWVRRVLKSIKSPRIPKELKKYQKAKVYVTYDKNLKCEYLANVRIHGSTPIHVNDSDLFTSVRVKLINGNINNITNFSLIKKDARKFEDEIFVSQIFEEIGFISPLNFKTLVSINKKNFFKEYLFIEEPSLQSLKNRDKNNGLIISGNRNNKIERKLSDEAKEITKRERSIILSRVKDFNGISKKNKNNLLYALDKMNYIYLNSLGIGNGIHCCEFLDENNKKLPIEKNYNLNNFYLNFEKLEQDKNFSNLIIFKLLMLATDSYHGLDLEDRSFYYNPTFDYFEPIYRDGDPNIVSLKSSLYKPRIVIQNFEKKYIDKAVNLLDKIDLKNFNSNILSKGLNLKEKESDAIIDKIKSNLINFKEIETKNFDSKNAPNYFFNHFDKNMKLNLVFGGINNIFEVCNISLKNCKTKKFSDEEFFKLLDKKFISMENFKHKLLFVRISKESYIKNIKPKKRSIEEELDEIKVEENLVIHTKDPHLVKIDNSTKSINLTQKNKNSYFVIIGKSKHPWKINLTGVNDEEIINFKRNEKMLGGCLNFLNSELKGISIKIKNALCPKAVEILNSNIYLSKLFVENSAGDALDAEFSKVKLDNVYIRKTKGECVGVKRGEYIINKAKLLQCGDKAISAGEFSKINVKNVEIDKSYVGLFAKNNSTIIAENLISKKNYYCLWSSKSPLGYNGSLIQAIDGKIDCGKGKVREDKNSKIIIN